MLRREEGGQESVEREGLEGSRVVKGREKGIHHREHRDHGGGDVRGWG